MSWRGRGAGCVVAMGRAGALVACVAIALGGGAVDAQVVAGTVSERGTGLPLAGVVLTVQNEQNQVVAEGLSGEDGAFELRVPASRTLTLTAKRIGMRRTRLAPFSVADGGRHEEKVVLEPVPTRIEGLRITGRSACVRSPANDVRTAMLWEDARAALAATVLSRRDRPTIDSVVRFARKLDPITWKVLVEERRPGVAAADRPFRSLPAADLSRDGYVRAYPDSSAEYFAPDADVLLSDDFLADHCFRAVAGTGAHAGQVGLSFEPVRGRRVPDVRGVLWMDARSRELHAVDFTYTWVPFGERAENYGGSVSFFRIPGGRWIVRSWRIRTPEFGLDRWSEGPSGDRHPLPRSSTPVLVGITEEGGAVPVHALLADLGTVRGNLLVDTTSNRPVPGTTVLLGGTDHQAVTDAEGGFVLPLVESGSYTVVLRDPILDSLGVEHLATTVEVLPGQVASLRLSFPSVAELSRQLCGDAVLLDREAIIRILVVDSATAAPLRGLPIVVSRSVPISAQGGDSVIAAHVATLDASGAYLACGVPAGQILHVSNRPEDPSPWRDSVTVSRGLVGWFVVRVRTRPRGDDHTLSMALHPVPGNRDASARATHGAAPWATPVRSVPGGRVARIGAPRSRCRQLQWLSGRATGSCPSARRRWGGMSAPTHHGPRNLARPVVRPTSCPAPVSALHQDQVLRLRPEGARVRDGEFAPNRRVLRVRQVGISETLPRHHAIRLVGTRERDREVVRLRHGLEERRVQRARGHQRPADAEQEAIPALLPHDAALDQVTLGADRDEDRVLMGAQRHVAPGHGVVARHQHHVFAAEAVHAL
jgi:Carboxypeptidase regulatory-like domain